MLYFYLKLNPPRPGFAQDMTPEERSIMQLHVAYWRKLMDKDQVLAYGPVLDPKGVYGVGIIKVESASLVNDMIKNDPANGLNSYEFYQMMAVVPAPQPANK